MAIDQGSETVTVTTQERTWRVNIETAMGAEPIVTIFRETVRTDANGVVISKETAPSAQRTLSGVATEVQDFTPSQSGKITGVEIAALIAGRADMWRTQDLAANAT